MSGEKRAVDKASWEFTVGLLAGILIGAGIVQDAGRVAERWRKTLCFHQPRAEDLYWNMKRHHN